MSSEPIIQVTDLSKCYHIYDRPQDRLRQAVVPRLQRLAAPLVRPVAPALVRERAYFREFWALRDVNFQVNPGQAVAIIGRNGCGKSTLLQIVCNTLTATTGEVDVRGRVAALLELGAGFNPEFTGRENAYMNAAILGLSREEMEARFEEVAAFADIGAFMDQPVKSYSSGMYVRLAFSVAISVEPDILVVDEALSVGDMVFRFKCTERIARLMEKGTTLLFVSHDLSMVKAICDHALYLENGRVKTQGPANEVAELYMMDSQEQQARAVNKAQPVRRKAHLGQGEKIAFGTSQGGVTDAEFAPRGTQQEVFSCGDRVRLRARVRYHRSVEHPSVSVVVNERRMLSVMGRYLELPPLPEDGDEFREVSVECAFAVPLAEGAYFITLRLEDRTAETRFSVVDKQVGVLSFDVVASGGRPFLGLVDLDMTMREVEEESGAEDAAARG